MNSIAEYKTSCSPYEVLSHLMDKVLSGELKTFEALRDYASPIGEGQRSQVILKKAFDLQRQLYWGFFKNIAPESFPKVWSQVVIPDRKYSFAGDLKRYMSISDIYMGMVDIHGYTRYCHKNRSNMSMLDVLDRMMQEDIPKIAAAMGVVSKRAQGDEILLLGSSAEEVLETVLRIVEYFARGARLPELAKLRAGANISPPEFQISAGIAGGQKFTPLIITRDGDLSGDIVNTAARLQSRADKISPEKNKILLSSQAYQKVKERKRAQTKLLLDDVDFFNTGTIEFKGVSLGVYDTVFMDREAYRLAYRDLMEELYESLDQGMWKSKIFEDSLRLAARLVTSVPGEACPPPSSDAASRDLSKSGFLDRIKRYLDFFRAENYEKAASGFVSLVEDLDYVPGMDELALDYLRSISGHYQALVAQFVESLDAEVSSHAESLLSPPELSSFKTLEKHHAMFERAAEAARSRVRGRKAIWYRIADEAAPRLNVVIQSKK
jgi:class 3 adenylate cyclase